ncbi:phage tail assembly chaperone [Altererythrobacter sp. MF3-039]|uniref:phage tail assembly chaperone n=1 Tax=Altererythrobacter sp. MF3-039 TaxID=3252901 RepID=UPI00390CAFB6
MSDTFANSARRLAGIAARLLGWRPNDFWNATPAELALALDTPATEGTPPSRSEIEQLIESDRHG